MLRLLDARTGRYAEVRPARPGLLRVGAYLPAGDGEPGWTGARVLLIADLLARVAELGGLQVITAALFAGEPPAGQNGAERAAASLGAHPAVARASADRAGSVLGGPFDVRITGPDDGIVGVDGPVARVGTVRGRATAAGGDTPAADTASASDPLAIRFALLSRPHDQPADLSDAVLAEPGRTLARWRGRVAAWAESPSRPMPESARTALNGAFSDLDIPQALRLLAELEQDAAVPDGSRFETFAFADRVLGLDLAREIGQPPR
ncbi:MAG: hypothetical protein ACYCO9_13955 [Streptosporangiaceae bacterium]